MRAEAAGADFYDSPWNTRHPRIQILTIEELFKDKKIDRPPENVTFKKAPRKEMQDKGTQADLRLDE